MKFYLYADHESAERLANANPKALLIGGDFGNGNFGDVLQHLGAASLVRASTGFAIVSLCVLDAVARHLDPKSMRESYGVDAVAFVSEVPIEAGVAAELGLCLVGSLQNISYVQLYGGGFLNELWGEFVLGITEQFLRKLPKVPYTISGQQLSPAFLPRIAEHIAEFAPRLIGVRDQASLSLLADAGISADFSFDDAVESLLELGRRLKPCAGDGAFIHLNTSDYTGNDEALSEMVAHLRLVAAHVGSHQKPVLLQAFQDAREVVVDSIETVKRLDLGFPFDDVEAVFLVTSILRAQSENAPARLLTGRFGYSSSYHVTLWLQLHGIPCWLRGSNSYYMQKRAALGIEGHFEDFLAHMKRPDHNENLRARAQWLHKLRQVTDLVEPAANQIEWEIPDNSTLKRQFHFKGEPRLEERLNQAWRIAENGREENERLKNRLDDAESRVQEYSRQLEDAESRVQEYSMQLEDAESRMRAYSRQLTEVGADARYFREQNLSMQSSLQQALASAEQLHLILASRSWRFTRPFRVASRFVSTGRFDSAGEIGVYAMLRIIGGKLPIKASWRSAVGRVLRRFRRR